MLYRQALEHWPPQSVPSSSSGWKTPSRQCSGISAPPDSMYFSFSGGGGHVVGLKTLGSTTSGSENESESGSEKESENENETTHKSKENNNQ